MVLPQQVEIGPHKHQNKPEKGNREDCGTENDTPGGGMGGGHVSTRGHLSSGPSQDTGGFLIRRLTPRRQRRPLSSPNRPSHRPRRTIQALSFRVDAGDGRGSSGSWRPPLSQ